MLFKHETGSSIIEVMVATVVFLIIMIGGLQYFVLPQSITVRQKIKRLAVVTAAERMETLLALDYTAVTADSNETNTPVTIGNISGYRNTTITQVDDSADGLGGSDADGETVDYKTVTVNISWHGNDRQFTLTTELSEFGNRDF